MAVKREGKPKCATAGPLCSGPVKYDAKMRGNYCEACSLAIQRIAADAVKGALNAKSS